MRKFGLLVAFGLLLTGAAPCGGSDDDDGSGEGDGSQGGAGTAGHEDGSPGAGQGGSEAPTGGGGRAGSTATDPGGGAGEGAADGDDDPAPNPPPDDGGSGGGGDGVECGPNTCDEGQVCCNASCGICTEPDGVCTQEACDEPSPGESCDLTCDAGQHCELVQVACVQAPCPPQPECVASPQCGGFAGFTCPGEGQCFDMPDDGCDPEMGGADCGGYCSCTVGPLIDCKPDTVFDPSPEVCACVKPAGDGVQCGDTTCASDEVCCNESCGICTPPDGACIPVICN